MCVNKSALALKITWRIWLRRRLSIASRLTSILLICMRYSLIALSQSRIRWGKPISVRFSRFNFENAWAYSWKQRWVFCRQASVENFAVLMANRLGFRTFIALWLVLADVFPPVESSNLSILPKLLGEATWQLLTYGEKETRDEKLQNSAERGRSPFLLRNWKQRNDRIIHEYDGNKSSITYASKFQRMDKLWHFINHKKK